MLLKLYSLVTPLVIKPINYLTCPLTPFLSLVMSFLMSQYFLSKMMTHNPIILIFSLILFFPFLFPFLPIIQQILPLVQFHPLLIVPPGLGEHLFTFKIIIVPQLPLLHNLLATLYLKYLIPINYPLLTHLLSMSFLQILSLLLILRLQLFQNGK